VQQDDLFIGTLKVKEHLFFQVNKNIKTLQNSKINIYNILNCIDLKRPC
jgi:hypothetical protein